MLYCYQKSHHDLTFSITVPQEIQQPVHLLTVVYQHDDNKVSDVDCQESLSHQPYQAAQGISKKTKVSYNLNAINHKHITQQKLLILTGLF
jgi:hypothetical protein